MVASQRRAVAVPDPDRRHRGERARDRSALPRPVVLLVTAVLALALTVPAAVAAPGDVGFAGPSTAGTGGAASGEKPESKLWWNDNRWWASLYHAASGTYHIWRLDRAASPKRWIDTGVVLDNRPKSRADTLWDGRHLYVASAVFASSNTAVVSGDGARLYRYSYDPVEHTYTLDAGFPASVNNTSSESITIDQDSSGRLWATWTQAQQVYFNATTAPGSDASWGTPRALPVANATGLSSDDISSVVAFGTPVAQGGSGGRIGVLWSNQTTSTTYFSIHNDGDPDDTWQAPESITLPGPGQSDDHLNIKDLQADDRGRVFVVIKTSLDDVAGTASSAPQIVVLARGSKGGWSRGIFGTIAECHTRPILVLDATNKLVHVYATAPDSGCPFSGTAGTVFEKTSPIDNLAFARGRGTPVMRNSASPNLNNTSSTKQTVNSSSGIVLLASDDVAKQYWSSDEPIGSPATAPTASFTASPTSGTAPLSVQFTDTSTGSPTAWSWSFGDGATSGTESESHILRGRHVHGESDGIRRERLERARHDDHHRHRPVGGQHLGGRLRQRARVHGDLGGHAQRAGRRVARRCSRRRVQRQQHPDGGCAERMDSHRRRIEAKQRCGGARLLPRPGPRRVGHELLLGAEHRPEMGRRHHRVPSVDQSHPLDIASPATKVDGTGTATSIALSGVVTVTDGAMLIGALGADGATATTTPPTGWTEAFDSVGGKMSEHAYRAQATAGASGSATWTISSARAMAVWMSALRPAP